MYVCVCVCVCVCVGGGGGGGGVNELISKPTMTPAADIAINRLASVR